MADRLATQAEAELDDIWYYGATESGNIDIGDRLMIPSPSGFIFSPVIRPSDDVATRICVRARGVFTWASMSSFTASKKKDALILQVFRGSQDIEALLRQ